jgi:hypothetical protein
VAAAAGLLVAPIALASSAAAAPVPSQAKILFFSDGDYTDPLEEDPAEIAALTETGATVTAFDGGDGTGAAWSAALAGKDALVIPESSSIYLSPVLDADAANVLYDFVFNGGRLILPTTYQAPLLSFLTGLDYASSWSTTNSSQVGILQVDDPALPATVTYSDATYPVVNYDEWSPELLAPLTPLYVNEANTLLFAGQWTVGTGTISVLAYDWYPGEEPEDIAGRALWNQLLQALTNVPVPALAATGSEAPVAPAAAAFGLLLLGAVGIFAVRARREVRA